MQPVNKQNKISSTRTGVKTFKNVCHGGPDINQAVQPCGPSPPGACSATYLCRAVKFCSAYTLLVMLLSGPVSVGSAVPLSVWLSAPLLRLSQGFWSDLCVSVGHIGWSPHDHAPLRLRHLGLGFGRTRNSRGTPVSTVTPNAFGEATFISRLFWFLGWFSSLSMKNMWSDSITRVHSPPHPAGSERKALCPHRKYQSARTCVPFGVWAMDEHLVKFCWLSLSGNCHEVFQDFPIVVQ